MKIAYTSDIHTDITENNTRLLPGLVNRVAEIDPHIFILAGDISNNLKNLDSSLRAFRELSCLKVMVPGNHDIWIDSKNSLKKGKDSFFKYRQAIPEICRNNGFIAPLEAPYYLDSCAIAGNIGWYDYTLRDTRLDSVYTTRDYRLGTFTEGTWNDTKYAVWLKNPGSPNWRERRTQYSSNKVFSLFFQQLQTALEEIPPSIKNIIIVLHMAPFRDCIIPKETPDPFDAYEGSSKLGEYIETIPGDKHISIICGHRHKKLILEKGNITVYRSPVGYLKKNETDYTGIARDRIGQFEIEEMH
ncbi:MAG: hypothetical protein GY754_29325 [bacterium]|nr:hypothetical protein [bacterium]